MPCTVKAVVDWLEETFPPETAEVWDSVGLQVGDMESPVARLIVALDPTVEAVQAAAGQGASLLVTHHPVWLQPLRTIRTQEPVGRIIWASIRSGVSVYCAHTNLDRAAGGPNDLLARLVGLREVEPVMAGMGRVGRLTTPMSLRDFCLRVQAGFPGAPVRLAGQCRGEVDRVAVCCGSGASALEAALAQGAQILVTGDVRYHDARRAESLGLALLDVGHFASERIVVPWLCEEIETASHGRGWGIDVLAYEGELEPFRIPAAP
jgi:dinuclear metal center YbgI/SA1388 family protein